MGKTENDDRCRSVSHLFILCPTQLDHVLCTEQQVRPFCIDVTARALSYLCSRMTHVDFSQNGMTIIRHGDTYSPFSLFT